MACGQAPRCFCWYLITSFALVPTNIPTKALDVSLRWQRLMELKWLCDAGFQGVFYELICVFIDNWRRGWPSISMYIHLFMMPFFILFCWRCQQKYQQKIFAYRP
jgi:hypothetical protein